MCLYQDTAGRVVCVFGLIVNSIRMLVIKSQNNLKWTPGLPSPKCQVANHRLLNMAPTFKKLKKISTLLMQKRKKIRYNWILQNVSGQKMVLLWF